MALENMTNSLAMPGGISYEEYLKLCLRAPLPANVQDQTSSQPSANIDVMEVK